MKKLKFKTNINCDNCVAKVTPFLNRLEGVEWQVQTERKDKILEVNITNNEWTELDVIKSVEDAGYVATPVRQGFFKKLFG